MELINLPVSPLMYLQVGPFVVLRRSSNLSWLGAVVIWAGGDVTDLFVASTSLDDFSRVSIEGGENCHDFGSWLPGV